MSRSRLFLITAAALSVVGATAATAFDGGLVRIEPRPYYGAVVTIEKGVRVYRPLPSPTLTIINPNQTPINLSFSRTIEHKAADGSGGSDGDGGQSDNGVRSSGFAGLGNVDGTNPQFNGNGRKHHRVVGVPVVKRHMRRAARH